jgi:hypothetical protein
MLSLDLRLLFLLDSDVQRVCPRLSFPMNRVDLIGPRLSNL